jgi:hypothetical protein
VGIFVTVVVVIFAAYFFLRGGAARRRKAIIDAATQLGVGEDHANRIWDLKKNELLQLVAATSLPECTIRNLPIALRTAHCIKIINDRDAANKKMVSKAEPQTQLQSTQPAPLEPQAPPKKSHFYIRGAGESLTSPVHIHFDSFKPAFEANVNAGGLTSVGTFLVTLTGDNYRPRGMTHRCSGVNHKLRPRGVLDGVIAHVSMVKDTGEGPIEAVVVTLKEDGTISGLTQFGDGYKEVDLADVYFSYGDTVFLDGDGNPLDDMNTPQPTARQRSFMQGEKDRMIAGILNR